MFNIDHPVSSYTVKKTRAVHASQIHFVTFVGYTRQCEATVVLWGL